MIIEQPQEIVQTMTFSCNSLYAQNFFTAHATVVDALSQSMTRVNNHDDKDFNQSLTKTALNYSS